MDSDHDAPEGGEVAALRELIASDGWKRFLAYADEQWGDSACLYKITSALRAVPAGDNEAEQHTTTQILSAQREVRRLLEWPTTRVIILKQPKPKKSALESLRRIARP